MSGTLVANVGGFGARLGLPWLGTLVIGRSERSEVEREDAGVGVVGADGREVILPPGGRKLF